MTSTGIVIVAVKVRSSGKDHKVAAAVTRNEKCPCFNRYLYLHYEAVIASHCAASMTMLPELCIGKHLQRIMRDLIEVISKHSFGGSKENRKKKNCFLVASLLLIWCTAIRRNYLVISFYYGLDVCQETYIAYITY
jgi:hypothetical protein